MRQGDPLSSIIFNLVIDEILANIPDIYGYSLLGGNVNALAFADDLVLLASTKEGLQDTMDGVVRDMALYSLSPIPAKCLALSLVPSGRDKKMKTITSRTFRISGCYIPQIGVMDTWKHLGIVFCHKGPTAPVIDMRVPLERIERAAADHSQVVFDCALSTLLGFWTYESWIASTN